MRSRLRLLMLISSLNMVLLVVIIYHERILTALEFIKVPTTDYSCHQLPFNLTRRSKLKLSENTNFENLTISQIESELSDVGLQYGGKWVPNTNDPRRSTRPFKVALIVPYRDRQRNLNIFLLYMHRFLSSQGVEYGVYLVEPRQELKFNRAMLLNIGFLEAIQDDLKWDCFIFHDVDMLPENENNIYQCDPNFPKQMAISINKFFYSYLKEEYFGGVSAFTKNQFLRINGYSNSYFGWGIEDDDARIRVMDKFPRISRQPPDIGRYFANCHDIQEKNPNRFLLYMTASSRMDTDGLNSVSYRIDRRQKTFLFTRLFIYYKDDV